MAVWSTPPLATRRISYTFQKCLASVCKHNRILTYHVHCSCASSRLHHDHFDACFLDSRDFFATDSPRSFTDRFRTPCSTSTKKPIGNTIFIERSCLFRCSSSVSCAIHTRKRSHSSPFFSIFNHTIALDCFEFFSFARSDNIVNYTGFPECLEAIVQPIQMTYAS